MSTDTEIFLFAGFELNVQTRLLTERGHRVPLQKRPFDLLLYLLKHRDRIVSREELLREVWPGIKVGPQALRFALYTVRRALRDGHANRTILRTIPGKGVAVTTRVRSINTLSHASPTSSRFSTSQLSVGRERLLKIVVDALSETKQQTAGSTILVHGDAGMGKTAFLKQLASLSAESGFYVLSGLCENREKTPSYWPWRQIIPRCERLISHPESITAVRDEAPIGVDATWPAIGREDKPHSPPLSWRRSRRQLHSQVTELLTTVARRMPVVVLIDDIHSADYESVCLFEDLAKALVSESVLMAVTYRDRELRENTRLAESLGRLAALEKSRYIQLTGLSCSDVRELIRRQCGIEPAPIQVDALLRKTNGNPLFLRHLLQVLETEERLSELKQTRLPVIGIPRYLQDVILDQLRALPEAVRDLLSLAAVAGAEFRVSDISMAARLSRDVVLEHMDVVVGMGVVECTHESGAYRFGHELVRDAIYEAMSGSDRRQAHILVGSAIESDPIQAGGPRAGEVAYHFSASGKSEYAGRAVRYSVRAADWEKARGAFEKATGHLENAVVQSELGGKSDAVALSALLIELGDACVCVGQRERAREAFRRAIAIAKNAGDSATHALAALRFAPDFLAIETGVLDSEQVAILEQALIAVGDSDRENRARICARLAVALHWSDESLERRLSLIEEAAPIAKESQDPLLSRYVATAKSLALFSVDRPEQFCLENTTSETRGDPISELVLRLLRVTSFWLMGDLGRVRREIQEFSDAANLLGVPQARWYTLLLESSLALMEGRYKQASTLGRRFAEEGRIAGDSNAFHSFILQSFMASIDVGGVEAFEDGVRAMVEKFPRVAGWRSGLLLLLTELGRFEEATALLDQIVSSGALNRPRRNEWFALLGPIAIASMRADYERWAGSAYEALLPHGDQFAVIGYGSYCWGSAQQLLGQCASLGRDKKLAIRHYDAALEINRLAGSVPAIARTHLDLSRLLWRLGDRGTARAHQKECIRICRRIGMSRLGGLAETLRI